MEEEFTEWNCTAEASKEVKAIGKDSIHRICSGQVVLSLAIAVKELVENSIDAGAMLVEVKLKKQGLESIEVIDNGCGVEKINFGGITAKHCTSKLKEFEDLRSVDTFGFRGEALSSLCALCDVVITTKHKTADVGSKLEFDHYGKIKSQSNCARTTGTTVNLTNIFGTLPVRQRELVKNIKTEFNKICQILKAYCLISKGVRIICTNQNNKGIWQTFLCTRGSQNVLNNIEDIYGGKETANLMEIKQIDDSTDDSVLSEIEELNNSLSTTKIKIEPKDISRFKIEGWISSCEHGRGSKLKDKQYFFINNRPCDPKQIIKAVNDIYHRYNVREYPFVFLNIITPKADVDVNLTKDKRQLLIDNEKILILVIKLSLTKTFQNIASSFKSDATVHKAETKSLNGQADDLNSEILENYELKSSQEKFRVSLSQWKAKGNVSCSQPLKIERKRKPSDEITAQKLKLSKIQKYLSSQVITPALDDQPKFLRSLSPDSSSDDKVEEVKSETSTQYVCFEHTPSTDINNDTESNRFEVSEELNELNASQALPNSQDSDEITHIDIVYEDENSDDVISNNCMIVNSQNNISITIEEIEQLVQHEEELEKTANEKVKLSRLKFKTEIDPYKNKNAEEELNRGVSKEMFSKMEVIGQYNLGFIIVKLEDDLFIVDQHATDEMYNFEMLQRSTQLQTQKLAVSKTLEFTTVNEMILMDNLDVFKANGFLFEIDKDAPATRRVKLLSIPFSKNWEFGKNDIDELIFMLHDAPPNTMCRPSRIRSMFASRACRKSVMIGTALKLANMRTLVDHMGQVEKPWNCPHGRPTMRHLVNLAMLRDES